MIPMRLRASEWIVVAYFVYLAGAAVVLRVNRRQRFRVVAAALTVVTVVFTFANIAAPESALRDWVPLAYVLLGYWLPGLLVTATNQKFEQTLLALDHRLFGIPSAGAIADRLPRRLIHLLELAYLFCYPMVPLGLASLYAAGLREESDRFWTGVFLAVFGCYGVLPLLPTQPPRAIEGGPARSAGAVRRLNLKVLGAASIQLNTFPSGHAAASVATALAVGARLPIAGAALGLLALGITVGSVVGRYHYAADAVAGAILGIAGFIISRFV
jgi:membrane-associated phospholipid phosphatase